MLYEIKVLKAPWPQGAKVGDVVDMPYLPVWAQGKCSIAADGAEATIEFKEPVAADGVNRPLDGSGGAGQALPPAEAIHAELDDARRTASDLQNRLDSQGEYLQRMQDDLRASDEAKLRAEQEAASLRSQLQELSSKQDKAPAGTDRAALEAQAKELGVDFSPNIGDKKLAERIAEAKAAKQ